MAVLDDYGGTDPASGWGGRNLPTPSFCTGDELLDPQPPVGWWCVVRYDTAFPVEPSEVGVWLYVLYAMQALSKTAGTRLHMICRESDSSRVLAVCPIAFGRAYEVIELLEGALDNGEGNDIEEHNQVAAIRVFLKRRWADVPVGLIVALMDQWDIEPEHLLDPRLKWLDRIDCAYTMFAVMQGEDPFD